MLDDPDHTAVLQPAQDRAAERGDAHRLAAQGSVADHVARTGLAHIEQRQAIDADADFGQHRRERHRIEPRRLDRAGGRAFIERIERRAAREIGPFGRFHPRDAPALLVDQDRQIVAPVEIAQFVGELAQLFAIFDVAAEQDISRRVAVAKESAFITGQGQTRKAENGRDHASTSTGQRPLKRRPTSP